MRKLSITEKRIFWIIGILTFIAVSFNSLGKFALGYFLDVITAVAANLFVVMIILWIYRKIKKKSKAQIQNAPKPEETSSHFPASLLLGIALTSELVFFVDRKPEIIIELYKQPDSVQQDYSTQVGNQQEYQYEVSGAASTMVIRMKEQIKPYSYFL